MAPDDRTQSQRRPVVSTIEARSGATGHNVRYVLIVGLVGVIVGFGVIMYVFFK